MRLVPPPEPIVKRPGSEILDDVLALILRLVIVDKWVAEALTLWCAMTYGTGLFHVYPLVVINAPERACGKSLLLQVVAQLVNRPLLSFNITMAALFRVIDKYAPTVLIDEADTFLSGKDELHGIINAGYTAEGFVLRVEQAGDRFEERAFKVAGPKALAGIALDRHLPEATLSRAIVAGMRRKKSGETVDRLKAVEPDIFSGLRAELHHWVKDMAEQLHDADPQMPPELSDRAADNWSPLFAVAQCAGGDWPDRARASALAMSASADEPQSASNSLLTDIREVLESHASLTIPTADLLDLLTRDQDMGWSTYNRGQPLTPRQLAKMLAAYGIKPKTVRQSAVSTPKGYEVKAFEDAFSRYLAPLEEKGNAEPESLQAAVDVAAPATQPSQSGTPGEAGF